MDPDYASAARRYLGEPQAEAYLDQPGTRMARIAVRPDWVGVVDFQTRLPAPSVACRPRSERRKEKVTTCLNENRGRQRTSQTQYDDNTLQLSDHASVIPWAEARDRLAEGRLFWWATTRPEGQPHVRPALTVLVDGVLYSTTNPNARKARNLAANPRFACAVSTDEIDFVLEGSATPVTDDATWNVSQRPTTRNTDGRSPSEKAHSTRHTARRPPAPAVPAVCVDARCHLRIGHKRDVRDAVDLLAFLTTALRSCGINRNSIKDQVTPE